MSYLDGRITVDYEGCIPGELEEYLRSALGVRVVGRRPLVLKAGRPEVVVNEAMRFFGDARMETRRVSVRPARGVAPFRGRALSGRSVPAADECA